MAPILSIVLPVYNLGLTFELLMSCLDAQSIDKELFECIFVDDGSTDGSAELLKRYQPSINIKRYYNYVNLGRSQARNKGWLQAEGEYVVFLDGDMLPEPQWLEGYLEAIEPNAPEIISGRRYSIDISECQGDPKRYLASLIGTTVNNLFVHDVPDQFQALRRHAKFGPYPNVLSEKLELQLRELSLHHPTNFLCAYSFITSNVAVRKSILDKTYGFSSFLRRGEDTELGIRLWELGARFGFAEAAKAYHLFDSRQPDRGISLPERISFFCRHPYIFNLMIPLWTAYNSPGAPSAPYACFNSLKSIADASRQLRAMDLNSEFYRLYRRPIPAFCHYTKDEIMEYYNEISGIPLSQIRQYLDLAIENGLFVIEKNNTVYFDIHHTSNWIKGLTPYQEYELTHASYGRCEKTDIQKYSSDSSPLAIKYQGKYDITISAQDHLAALRSAGLCLPVPVDCDYQSDVEIGDVEPPNLFDYYDLQGRIITYPLSAATPNRDLRISYEFSCTVYEHTRANSGGHDPLKEQTAKYLISTLPPEYKRKAQGLLKKIIPALMDDPVRIAKQIYLWMLDNTIYLQTPPTPSHLFFDTGYGTCAHFVGMFVNLCRLLQIPARERACALLLRGNKSVSTVIENFTRGYTPYTHAYAEFYDPVRGWTPVDFLTWGYGKRGLNPKNVVNEKLRQEIIKDTEMYDEYYFGSLDPYRIHVSESASSSKFIVGKQYTVNEAVLQGVLSKSRHHLRCKIEAN